MPQRPPRKGRPLHLKTSATWRRGKLGTHGIGKHTSFENRGKRKKTGTRNYPEAETARNSGE